MDRRRQLATLSGAAAVAVLWFTLYRTLPAYPPALGLPLAVDAVLFLSELALLHRIHASLWQPLAQFGFGISACGLGLWLVGGAVNALGAQVTIPQSIGERFAVELISQPQPGWGGLKYILGERTGGLMVFAGFGIGWLAIGALLLFEARRVRVS